RVRRPDGRGDGPGPGRLPPHRQAHLGVRARLARPRAGRLCGSPGLSRTCRPEARTFFGPLLAPITHCLSARPWGPGGEAVAAPQRAERSIFLQAIEIPAAQERAAFLEAACEGDRRLRELVEALLSAHEQPQGLLDTPEVAVPTDTGPTAAPGAVVGAYKL